MSDEVTSLLTEEDIRGESWVHCHRQCNCFVCSVLRLFPVHFTLQFRRQEIDHHHHIILSLFPKLAEAAPISSFSSSRIPASRRAVILASRLIAVGFTAASQCARGEAEEGDDQVGELHRVAWQTFGGPVIVVSSCT
jgi:hypothetical protein